MTIIVNRIISTVKLLLNYMNYIPMNVYTNIIFSYEIENATNEVTFP